jgi:hypothetical protein
MYFGDQQVGGRKNVEMLLTAKSEVLFEKLTVRDLFNKLPAFYVTRRFIVMFAKTCHLC